jgi:hypothetical protein
MSKALLLAGVILAAALADPANALPVYPRKDWSVGIGLGLGRGEIESPDGSLSEGLEGPSPQWRVARKLGTHWALGVEYEGWFHEEGDSSQKLRRSLQFFGLAVDWYPGNPANAWSGVYLRAAAGIGYTRHATVYLNDEGEQIDQVAEDDSGPGLVLGAGYEFWLARYATVGLATSTGLLWPDGQAVKSGWFSPLAFFFNVRF